MIEPAARGSWRDLEAKLRPFVARRVTAEGDVDDVLQDVFLRMQRGLAGLRDEELFGPWVYQVARSAIVDHVRTKSRHRVAQDDAPEQPALDTDEQLLDDSVARGLAMYVASVVALLPSPYREALTLTELQGLTQKDAAAMLGVSLSAMKSRVQRGREKVRAALDDCCHIALDARGHVISCEPRADRPASAAERRARLGSPPWPAREGSQNKACFCSNDADPTNGLRDGAAERAGGRSGR